MGEDVVFYSKYSQFGRNNIVLYSDPYLCHQLRLLAFSECLGKSVLLFGESNVGKTEITSEFLSFVLSSSKLEKIYVVDIGPERFRMGGLEIGGKISDFDDTYHTNPKVTTFSYPITPPRSNSSSYLEIYKKSLQNYKIIIKDMEKIVEYLFSQQSISCALIINDLSIFLHMGSLRLIRSLLKTSHTIFVNSYYGTVLSDDFGSNLTFRERVLVNRMIRHFDYPIRLIH
ncbi:MAG: hypothetical protein JW776_01655 [Candidatus Lokiarchaeota archaeon]|nr:hypothetical protein [Candidatus Lokiarchaeota archaeon]